jgi:hypothetical protein
MLVHAIQILKHELDAFLKTFPPVDGTEKVFLGNIAQADTPSAPAELKTKVVMSLVNLREEKSMKNGPVHRLNNDTNKYEYFNPSIFLNFNLLVSAGNATYPNALTQLSRSLSFFQGKNVFTHLNSVNVPNSVVDPVDRMDEFKMCVDLLSPSFEEINHLWGTLGGKQVPFALYKVRLTEVQRNAKLRDGDQPIQEVQTEGFHKTNEEIIAKREELSKV